MDFNSNVQSTGCVMIQMIVHNGVLNSSDIEAEWQNSRLLKVRIRWPDWFTSVLQMMEFNTTNANGTPTPAFGRDHPLTISFGECVRNRLDDDKQV